MLQVRRMNSAESNGQKQGRSGEHHIAILRCLVDRMDGFLIRTLGEPEKNENLGYFLGDTEQKVTSAKAPIFTGLDKTNWSAQIKTGRFMYYKGSFGKDDSDSDKFRLVVCLDNIDKRNKVTMLSVKTINYDGEYHLL